MHSDEKLDDEAKAANLIGSGLKQQSTVEMTAVKTTEAPFIQTTTNSDRRLTQGASYLEEQIQQFNK